MPYLNGRVCLVTDFWLIWWVNCFHLNKYYGGLVQAEGYKVVIEVYVCLDSCTVLCSA